MNTLGYSKNLHVDIPPQQTSKHLVRVHSPFQPPVVDDLFDPDDAEGFAKRRENVKNTLKMIDDALNYHR